ncbi:MAG: plastocyanin/azurin family copper-binding protein [bacterium]
MNLKMRRKWATPTLACLLCIGLIAAIGVVGCDDDDDDGDGNGGQPAPDCSQAVSQLHDQACQDESVAAVTALQTCLAACTPDDTACQDACETDWDNATGSCTGDDTIFAADSSCGACFTVCQDTFLFTCLANPEATGEDCLNERSDCLDACSAEIISCDEAVQQIQSQECLDAGDTAVDNLKSCVDACVPPGDPDCIEICQREYRDEAQACEPAAEKLFEGAGECGACFNDCGDAFNACILLPESTGADCINTLRTCVSGCGTPATCEQDLVQQQSTECTTAQAQAVDPLRTCLQACPAGDVTCADACVTTWNDTLTACQPSEQNLFGAQGQCGTCFRDCQTAFGTCLLDPAQTGAACLAARATCANACGGAQQTCEEAAAQQQTTECTTAQAQAVDPLRTCLQACPAGDVTCADACVTTWNDTLTACQPSEQNLFGAQGQCGTCFRDCQTAFGTCLLDPAQTGAACLQARTTCANACGGAQQTCQEAAAQQQTTECTTAQSQAVDPLRTCLQACPAGDTACQDICTTAWTNTLTACQPSEANLYGAQAQCGTCFQDCQTAFDTCLLDPAQTGAACLQARATCASACGGPGPQTHTVNMQDFTFDPVDVQISVGDTVQWVNNGPSAHTSTSGTNCTADGTWDSGLLNMGQTFSQTFDTAGTFPYFCIPHCALGMTGTVTVTQ